MKYVIDLEEIEGTGLYKAKGFNALVFDKMGIEKLEPFNTVEVKPLNVGDIIKTPNGTTEYEFCGYSNDNKINCINLSNCRFCNLSNDKVVVVRRAD